jgi:hypothetical protein
VSIAACTVEKRQPSAQTSPQTQTPFQQSGVLPLHPFPHDPQLAGFVSVLVQLPGFPQQSGVLPEQAAPFPHRHWWFAQTFPVGAHAASSQQIPVTHEPPQQTSPALQ